MSRIELIVVGIIAVHVLVLPIGFIVWYFRYRGEPQVPINILRTRLEEARKEQRLIERMPVFYQVWVDTNAILEAENTKSTGVDYEELKVG
jgi:hypothetical protein